MTICHSPGQAATASKLAEELADYEFGLRELLHGGWDPARYRQLSDLFDRMQMQAMLLPKLDASWTELLITRVDLLHALWSASDPRRMNGKVVAFLARHRVLIEEVRHTCGEYVEPGTRVAA